MFVCAVIKCCPMCKQDKLKEFFRNGFCIECSKEYKKKEYAKHKDRYAERYQRKRNAEDYFVYKFINNHNQIIYIGKTIRLPARMIEHFKTDGHLPDECYGNVASVFYCPLKTKADMDIYEIYLISKYKPQYNSVFTADHNKPSTLEFPELHWLEYKEVI